jgi:hypothetical protein
VFDSPGGMPNFPKGVYVEIVSGTVEGSLDIDP